MGPGRRAFVSLAGVAALYLAFRAFGRLDVFVDSNWAEAGEGVSKILLWVVPTIVLVRVTGAARDLHGTFEALGLGARPAAGYRFGLLASLPMLAILPFGAPVRLDAAALVGSVLLGPFAEEVLFRGFLLRQLHLWARWSAPVAIATSAFAFGLAHLANVDMSAPNAVPLAAVEVAMTTGGGLLFGWIVVRWRSLWPAVGLHTFMNLTWEIFGVDHWAAHAQAGATAVGPEAANIARLLTVTIAIALTVRKRLTN
jgi:CAAX protease family protein